MTKTFDDHVAAGSATTAEALALFDSLPAVGTDFMIGAWAGAGFPTAHPLDGLLENFHWHGKRFDSTEDVHPLVFLTAGGRKVHVNPAYMKPSIGPVAKMKFVHSPVLGRLFQSCVPLFATGRSRARLRMTTYRGVSTATMIYDELPINDVFRKVDENTVLGVMDLKTIPEPFFFVLRRERGEN